MNNWHVMKTHDDGKYTVEEVVTTQALDEGLAPARGVITGVVIGAVAWAVFIGIVIVLMNLPGIP
jgi:hypothetical protein